MEEGEKEQMKCELSKREFIQSTSNSAGVSARVN